MIPRALNAAQVAAELGRSAAWLHDNWRRLVDEKKLPRPIMDAGGITWNAAQLYATLDRNLPAGQRAAAAAYRAAVAAALATTREIATDDEVEESRARLNAKFAGAKATP